MDQASCIGNPSLVSAEARSSTVRVPFSEPVRLLTSELLPSARRCSLLPATSSANSKNGCFA